MSAHKVAALGFIALAVATGAYALNLRLWVSAGPGPGLFPLAVAIGLGLVALLWLVQLIRDGSEPFALDRGGLARVALQLAALALFAALLRPLGYIASAALLVVLTALIAGERSWLWMAVVAAIAAIGGDQLFTALGARL